MKNECAAIILAAGNSSRMGQPKFALSMPNGNTFLENIVRQYVDFKCSEIFVVLNNEGVTLLNNYPQRLPSQTQIVLNSYPEFGRFFSIKTGLKLINSSFVFIHNVDNPYANSTVLTQIYEAKLEADVIKPVKDGRGGHPVLISRKVIDCILHEKNYSINFKEYLKKFQSKSVVVRDETILYNINTYDEYLELY